MAFESFQKKAGPLPLWGWGALLLGGALVYALVKQRQASSSSDTSSNTGDPTSEVPSDQVPDFISQVYSTTNITNQPPAPPPTTTTTTPPASPPKTTVSASPPATKVPTTPPPQTSVSPPKTTTTKPKAPISYKVKSGDTLSSIAKKYGTTWQALWTYNTTSGNRPADTIKTLKSRGPDLLYSGETILIPQK